MVELNTPTKILIVLGIAITVYFIYSKSQSSTPPPEPPTSSPTSAPTSSSPTSAPTSSPIPSGTMPDISGVWEVYDSTGKTNYNFTITFLREVGELPGLFSRKY